VAARSHILAAALAVLAVGSGRAAEPQARIAAERGLAGCEQAVTALRAELAAAPDDPAIELALADALLCVVRIRTDGNALLVEGGSDTPEHRAIWRQMAPETVALARAAREARPDDPLALATYTEAYMYDASSQGIVEAILKGAAGEYKRNAQALIDRFPSYENGAGYVFMGSFYFVAPWPMSDAKRGRGLLEQALAVAPSSRRNLYFAGVAAYRTKDYGKAAELFEKVAGGTCTTPNERDLCDFVTRESARLAPLARTAAAAAR
jgi:tetratricopeptide (TPR) repeat protein